GIAIQKHLSSKDEEKTLMSASLLHMMGIEFYAQAAKGKAFRQHQLSLWVRVPVKHPNDAGRKGFSSFFPTYRCERAARGTFGFITAFLTAMQESELTQRTITEEKQAIEEAERTFRQIEVQSPIKLVAFTRPELWEALYLGHCQNANSVPLLPPDPACDLNDYLC